MDKKGSWRVSGLIHQRGLGVHIRAPWISEELIAWMRWTAAIRRPATVSKTRPPIQFVALLIKALKYPAGELGSTARHHRRSQQSDDVESGQRTINSNCVRLMREETVPAIPSQTELLHSTAIGQDKNRTQGTSIVILRREL